ncbi:13594_t:CDS:2 [Funneliformis geosporum]|uniref:16616_t:CDS:1 n=1 Tax=Funneliformis geosporum TaxID=1117311 RepID=A0A9W4WU53_9GLOM|nr:13594_t:CDS:2 [Funneliformis geosporum]CAI2172363.1 16616_t:CDS:2 [Funneliformis geosporum]
MKLSIYFAIFFGLLVHLAQGHTVWIQNKVTVGTFTAVAATETGEKKDFSWYGPYIDMQSENAHKGYHLIIPENITTFWLVFGVAYSLQENKWRGPINNDGDKCWHYHGTLDGWDVYEC